MKVTCLTHTTMTPMECPRKTGRFPMMAHNQTPKQLQIQPEGSKNESIL